MSERIAKLARKDLETLDAKYQRDLAREKKKIDRELGQVRADRHREVEKRLAGETQETRGKLETVIEMFAKVEDKPKPRAKRQKRAKRAKATAAKVTEKPVQRKLDDDAKAQQTGESVGSEERPITREAILEFAGRRGGEGFFPRDLDDHFDRPRRARSSHRSLTKEMYAKGELAAEGAGVGRRYFHPDHAPTAERERSGTGQSRGSDSAPSDEDAKQEPPDPESAPIASKRAREKIVDLAGERGPKGFRAQELPAEREYRDTLRILVDEGTITRRQTGADRMSQRFYLTGHEPALAGGGNRTAPIRAAERMVGRALDKDEAKLVALLGEGRKTMVELEGRGLGFDVPAVISTLMGASAVRHRRAAGETYYELSC